MKKITLITMQLKTPGGIERFICTLAQILSRNHQVEIIINYGKSTDPLAFQVPPNVKLTFLSPQKPQEISMKNLVMHFKWHQIPHELKRRYAIKRTQNHVFQQYFSNLQTDYIITERAKYNSLVNKFYHGNAKKIATDHNFHQNNAKYIHTLIKSLRSFNYLIVATKELQKFYQPKLPNLKCLFIPNPLSSIPTKKSPLNTKNLIAVGRFVPEKDFLSLIDVMAKIHALNPDIHLTLIGDGIEMPRIKQKIKDLSLSQTISLPGFVPQSDIAKYYYQSSLFIMTSRTESFALVLAEAMSYGVPCIAFDRASGARAQINPKTGILIPHSNVNLMATTIISLFNHPAKLRQYQDHIAQYVSTISPDAISKLWARVVE